MTVDEEAAAVSVVDKADASVERKSEQTLPPLPSLSALDPSVRTLVKSTLKGGIASAFLMGAVIFIMLLLFFGSGWNPTSHTANIHFALLDADGGLVGSALTAAAATLPYTVVSRSAAAGATPASVAAEVDAGTFHAALLAQPGATAALLAALPANSSAAARYNPSAALTFVFDEGRIGSALAPLLRSAAAQAAAVTAARVQFALLSSQAAAAMATPVLVQPVAVATLNLHPVPWAGENAAAGIAVIDQWIVVLAATSVMLKLYAPWEKAGIRRDHAVLSRVTHELLVTGALAFWQPVTLLVLGAKFPARTFFALWAYCWLFMCAMGFIITALFIRLGEAAGSVIHTLFLILNLVSSTSTTPQELMPPFFQVGYALPFYNAVCGLRTILFGSYDRLGRNVGVLFAWCGLAWGLAARAAMVANAELRLRQAQAVAAAVQE